MIFKIKFPDNVAEVPLEFLDNRSFNAPSPCCKKSMKLKMSRLLNRDYVAYKCTCGQSYTAPKLHYYNMHLRAYGPKPFSFGSVDSLNFSFKSSYNTIMSKRYLITQNDLKSIKLLRDKMKEAMIKVYIPGPNVNNEINPLIERLESGQANTDLVSKTELYKVFADLIINEDEQEFDEVYSELHNRAIRMCLNKVS